MADLDEAYQEFFSSLATLVERARTCTEEGQADIMFNLLKDYQNALRSIHMDFPNIAKADVETLMNNIQSIRAELRRKFNKENIKLAVLDDLDYDTPQKLGRPKYNISEDTLIFYRGLGFSWNDIASLLMVSRWTVYRRIDEYGIREITGYSKISDDQLDSMILELKKQHGICLGRPMIIGHLRSMGLRIQHRRVMESLVRIDPEGSNMRWRIIIRRRKYSVPGPNSLWHLDGHHSLINWGFVIHGCIDGMSRMITFLCCSSVTIEQKLS
uniref:Integrase core domain-containing protein n=1 Tax=Clytia hemisphaerica TaxID=252671 RepID=A0A7M5X880_9CNID|eukprot:TCONS_00030326-protein